MKKWTIITLAMALVILASCRKEEFTVEYLSPEEVQNLPNTGLPVVIIKAPFIDSIRDLTKDWSNGDSIIIVNPDLSIDLRTTTSIKGRGNVSWDAYEKKPYNLKLDQKASVLGMHSNRHWCLLSNWLDRTSIRNALSFEVARHSPSLDWTPEGRFVEVVFNGKHLGNYYLCEKIRVDEYRVNITELSPNATSGDELTGGYLMEIDGYYDETQKFRSEVKNMPWMFRNPDDVNTAQYQYMKDYVNSMEHALYDDDQFRARKFAEYMDLESFADYWIVNEIAMNYELQHPKSCFMHKDINSPIKAGPVWDFDWETYKPEKTEHYWVKDTVYYGRLFQDTQFRKIVKRKWNAQKNDYINLTNYIDQLHNQLAASDRIDSALCKRWASNNEDPRLSFDEAIDRVKTAYIQQINWLDKQISQW